MASGSSDGWSGSRNRLVSLKSRLWLAKRSAGRGVAIKLTSEHMHQFGRCVWSWWFRSGPISAVHPSVICESRKDIVENFLSDTLCFRITSRFLRKLLFTINKIDWRLTKSTFRVHGVLTNIVDNPLKPPRDKKATGFMISVFCWCYDKQFSVDVGFFFFATSRDDVWVRKISACMFRYKIRSTGDYYENFPSSRETLPMCLSRADLHHFVTFPGKLQCILQHGNEIRHVLGLDRHSLGIQEAFLRGCQQLFKVKTETF